MVKPKDCKDSGMDGVEEEEEDRSSIYLFTVEHIGKKFVVIVKSGILLSIYNRK